MLKHDSPSANPTNHWVNSESVILLNLDWELSLCKREKGNATNKAKSLINASNRIKRQGTRMTTTKAKSKGNKTVKNDISRYKGNNLKSLDFKSVMTNISDFFKSDILVANKGKDNKLKPSTTKASKLKSRQGTKTIKAKSKGNRTHQQNCISWSKR